MTDKELENRNQELCQDWSDWHDSELPRKEQVADLLLRLIAKYGIAERTVYQILEKNANTFLAHANHERVKRIFRIKREIAQKEKSNKDVADLLEQLRKEYDGDSKIAVINTVVNKVGTNGTFSGEDRELADRYMGVLREKLQK